MKRQYLWLTLVVLRWLTVLWPQTGYIHPDEFFQSVEVVSGDVLDIEVHKTWEFRPSKPIRSTLLPCLLYWPAFLALKACSVLCGAGELISAYSMVIAPRIVIAIVGTAMDYVVYKLMKLYKGFDVDVGMLMYTSSYVSFVYYTRTLSNTIEAFLFIFMLYTIQKNIKQFSRYDKIHPRTKQTKCTRQNYPIPENVEYMNVVDLVLIGTCLVAGVFNRPTFLLFAYAPYLHWLFDGYIPDSISDVIDSFKFIMGKIKVTLLIVAPVFIIFTVWDTNYYNGNSLIVTPFNFIDYNWKSENLEKHGTHSRWTHLFVNIPMLFGPVIAFVLFDIVTYITTKGNIAARRTSVIDGIETKFWLHSYILPLILLSAFPHQEPRFLIPLLVPFVILYSHLIFGYRSIKIFKWSWIFLNITGGMFYGCFHQGRLLSSIDFFKHYAHKSQDAQMHVIYSHTYMPPKHLFTIEDMPHTDSKNAPYEYSFFSSDALKVMFDNVTYVPPSNLKIYDMKGKPLTKVEQKISEILKKTEMNNHRIYLVTPSSMELEVCTGTSNQYIYEFFKQFKGHLTMEDLPSKEHFDLSHDRGFPMTFCGISTEGDTTMSHGRYSSLYSLNTYKVSTKEKYL